MSEMRRFPSGIAANLVVVSLYLGVWSTALQATSLVRESSYTREASDTRQTTHDGELGTRFVNQDQVLHWMSTYRDDPNPDYLPDVVKSLGRLGLLRDDQRTGVYFGFVGGVLADNQVNAKKIAEAMFPLRPEYQIIIIRGLAYSGLPRWKNLLQGLAERMPARKVMLTKYLYGDAKTLAEMSLEDGPQVLDAWWGYYFATGSYYAALKVISALQWAKEENDVERLTVASMAKWTLATNASRDKYLLDFLRAEQSHQPDGIKQQLREIVVAAENFEVSKLRQKTLLAIEELKKSGPGRYRKWSWWGQAGQTALAVGCVAASALGQVQFGLPCILGGAASNGLLRILQLQQTKP
ncbi:MAG: hypothetical protein ACR2PG_05230 [Hyphomicrobiaceae bacterium]